MCKKVLLPFHSAYHQYFQQESPLLLFLSSFDCTGYAKPKHLPNLGITDQPVLSTWLQIPRVAGRIIAPKLSKCEHDFSQYERTLKKQKTKKKGLNEVHIQYIEQLTAVCTCTMFNLAYSALTFKKGLESLIKIFLFIEFCETYSLIG